MKILFQFLVLLIVQFNVYSQSKPPIDSTAIANWSDLLESTPIISPDGKYFMYSIWNLPVGNKTLVIQSTENEWKKEVVGAEHGFFFSGNSQLAVFKNGDSIYLQTLGLEKLSVLADVVSYKNHEAGENQLLFYLTKSGELIVHNLLTGQDQRYQNITEYQFDNSGKALLLRKKSKADNSSADVVQWINLSNNKEYIVWQAKDSKNASVSRFSFDEAGEQLVFVIQQKNNDQFVNTIWYYKEGMKGAIEKITNGTPGIDTGRIVSSGTPSFSKNGRYIFFKTQSKPETQPLLIPNAVQLDVWNYKDIMIQELQLFFKKNHKKIPERNIKSEFLACIGVDNSDVKQLEDDIEQIAGNFRGEENFFITSSYTNIGDRVWLESKEKTYYLTSFKEKTGKKYLTTGLIPEFLLSPNKRFLVFFDPRFKHYFSYNIERGILKNISKQISSALIDTDFDEFIKPNTKSCGIAGWVKTGELLVYDNYDIWKVDPSCNKAPNNMTNGYGKANNIKFVLFPEEIPRGELPVVNGNKPVLLSAFNNLTKKNGFFEINIAKGSNPKKLVFDSFLYHTTSRQTEGKGLIHFRPVKAKKANLWIVQKQTMTDAPNFFLTKDFLSFKRLTDMQPQKKAYWSTAELLTWKQNDGKICQGILYKPDDFDPTKKYPVVINYYEKVSANLHQFIRPQLSSVICIPWFVSRGYLVFTPDIHYTVRKVSKSVVNSIIPGVHELFKRPFVNQSAIGIQGHSFGGNETNVLITESNLFAAAVEGAGSTNYISHYGSLLPTDGYNGQASFHLERGGQKRMDVLLWQDQKAYIENSPIFKVNKITTPLLIMHNKADQAVPWGQAVEFFIALRRLDKPVWMLQYDDAGHGVNSLKDKIDYINRMTQFFDHYLKGVRAPKWMTQGIPATLKGIDAGLVLDPNGKCSETCVVCNKQISSSSTQ